MTQDPHGEQLLAQRAFVQRLAQALLRDRDLAADVAQDAIVAAIERPPAAPTPLHLRAWLRTVVHRIAAAARHDRAERVRRERRAARPEGDDAEREANEQLARHRELTAAVDALPEPYRTAVALRYLADRKPAAIAREVGATPHVVSQRIHRGLQLLRQRLDRDHGSRAAWATPLAAALPATSFVSLLAATAMAKNAFVAAAVLAVAATGTWLAVRTDAPPLPAADGATKGAAVAAAALTNAATRAEPMSPAPASSGATARTSAKFTVVVVDARGAAVDGVEVHCFCADGEPGRSTTSGGGRAEFPARDERGGVVVLAAARPPLLARFDALRGEQRVMLADGHRVAGRVLVDGAPAPAGMRLQLATAPRAGDDAPEAIVALLRRKATVTTGPNGRFAFVGLDADWQGTIEVPRSHWLLPQPGQSLRDERVIALLGPIDDLLLATTHLQTIAGRVVWADDGSPVANAGVDSYGTFADSWSTPLSGGNADEQGKFEAAFVPGSLALRERWRDPARRSELVQARLVADSDGSEHRVHVDLDRDGIARAIASPIVLRLPRARPIHFRAIDTSGHAVAGACVQTNHVSAPSDASGNGTFTGPGERMLVGGPGYEIAAAVPERPAAGNADDPLVFVLQPCSAVTLHVRSATGAPAPRDLRVLIETQGPLFTGSVLQAELVRALGSACAFGSLDHASGRSQAGVDVDDNGDARLFSLVPGQPCVVTVADRLGTELLRRELTTPARGTTDGIDLVVALTVRRVRGVVAALGGRPIAEARVGLGTAAHRSYVVDTGADGTFDFGTVCDDSAVTLSVSAPGFAPQRHDGLSGPVDESFWLEPSRRVAVRIVDDSGALVAAPSLVVRGVPGKPDVQQLGPGEFTVVDLPARDVTFAVAICGREFTCTPSPTATTAELRVPTMAHATFGPLPEGFALPAVGSIGVRGQCLQPRGEPFVLALQRAGDGPALLPPGHYRFVLVRNEWNAERHVTETTELQAAAEVDLVAGATATVTLQ